MLGYKQTCSFAWCKGRGDEGIYTPGIPATPIYNQILRPLSVSDHMAPACSGAYERFETSQSLKKNI